MLTPLVRRLRHMGLPRVPAVFVAVGVGTACAAAIILMISVQAVRLADRVPEYHGNIEQKIHSLRD